MSENKFTNTYFTLENIIICLLIFIIFFIIIKSNKDTFANENDTKNIIINYINNYNSNLGPLIITDYRDTKYNNSFANVDYSYKIYQNLNLKNNNFNGYSFKNTDLCIIYIVYKLDPNYSYNNTTKIFQILMHGIDNIQIPVLEIDHIYFIKNSKINLLSIILNPTTNNIILKNNNLKSSTTIINKSFFDNHFRINKFNHINIYNIKVNTEMIFGYAMYIGSANNINSFNTSILSNISKLKL